MNSARGRSPRYKYNVPVSIFTTLYASSFFTDFTFLIILLRFTGGGNSGIVAISPDERVPIRVDLTFLAFLGVTLVTAGFFLEAFVVVVVVLFSVSLAFEVNILYFKSK